MYEQLKSQFLVNSNFWHKTNTQGVRGIPLDPPIVIVDKMKFGEMFRPCLKSSYLALLF